MTGGCNVEQVLRQCKTPFTTDEVTKVWEHLPRLCNILKTKGEISEKDYLPLQIASEGGMSRDGLVLNRRRFIFLTNLAFIAREDQKRVDKLNAVEDKKDKAVKRKAAAEIKRAKPPAAKRVKKNAPVVAAPAAPDAIV